MEVLAERVGSVFLRIPASVLVAVVNAAMMTAILVSAEHDRGAWAWFAGIVVVAGIRLGLWQAHRRAPVRSGQVQHWAMASVGGALVSGLLWGAGAVLLFPQDEIYRLFWGFLIGGMCAGAAVHHAAHPPTALAFMVPAAFPLAVRFAAERSERGSAAAAMTLMFLLALSVSAHRSGRNFGDMLRMRFALARQTTELDRVNARLRREIEEHRATEASLRHAQKMEAMGQLTGGIAHDFNNLLMAVLGSLEMLRDRVPAEDSRAARLLENAVRGAEKGAALTQRLLAFGRRQALDPQVVDVPALVRSMADLLGSSLGAGVRVETRFPVVMALAHVDANQLELALLNLALNARDAMPEGGRLVIEAREEQAGPEGASGLAPGFYVVLGVTDSGAGMDEATLGQATEPFFTTKEVGKGTGLGLSMAHGLAGQSGGKLVLRSRKGEGTTVELWLPRAEIASVPSAASAGHVPARPRLRRTVLLVDDDPLVLDSAAAMLEDLGHAVIEAASAREALDILASGTAVDLVITDHAMPGMTGLELAEELGRLRPGLGVLLATGYAGPQAPGGAGPARLLKPFGRDALIRATEACFGEAGRAAQVRRSVDAEH